MDTDGFIIEQMQPIEFEEVAILLTDAFYSNPAYSAIFKNKNQLKEGLFWLFKASLLINNEKQPLTMAVKDKNNGEIIGTYTLIPPQGIKNSIAVYSKIRLGHFITKFGLSTLIRMLSLNSKNKKLLTEALGYSGYYYLSMVVVKEEYRGYGIGSFMINHAIDRFNISGDVQSVIGLTTQLPENVVFYSRLGFSKIDEEYITFRESKYYNCNMKYDFL